MDEADRLLDMGYEKDVAAIVKAIEDHKKAATYDPLAMVKLSITKKIDSDDTVNTQHIEKLENKEVDADIKHHLTEVFLSKEHQTILLSATLSKVCLHYLCKLMYIYLNLQKIFINFLYIS